MFEPIKCELTKNDLKDFCTFSMEIERIQKLYSVKKFRNVSIFIILLFSFSEFILFNHPSPTRFISIFFIVFLLFMIFFYKTLITREWAKKLCKLFDDSDSWNSEICLSEDYIVAKDNHAEAKCKYSSIVDIYKTENFLYVYVSPYSALIIPKRAFYDEAIFNDVYNFLNNKIAAPSSNNQQ